MFKNVVIVYSWCPGEETVNGMWNVSGQFVSEPTDNMTHRRMRRRRHMNPSFDTQEDDDEEFKPFWKKKYFKEKK